MIVLDLKNISRKRKKGRRERTEIPSSAFSPDPERALPPEISRGRHVLKGRSRGGGSVLSGSGLNAELGISVLSLLPFFLFLDMFYRSNTMLMLRMLRIGPIQC